APDWTADWLHRECVFILNAWADEDYHKPYDQLAAEDQARLRARLEKLHRANDYRDGTLTIDPVRARAFEDNVKHYSQVFSEGNEGPAAARGAVTAPARLRKLCAFFFWTAWASAANRPGQDVSYTQNWPHEPLVGNRPTGETIVWTGVSVIMLLAGISAM